MCPKCNGRGWTESWQGGAASWTPSLLQCPKRCNITGYSNEVQRRLNNPNHVTDRPVVRSKQAERAQAQVIPIFGNPKTD